MDFYNLLGADYDLMTQETKRRKREEQFFVKLAEQYGFKTALDIGCGTGQHMAILCQMGIRTVGVDPSETMLDIARKKLANFNNCQIVKGDLLSIPTVDAPYESIFCLGNTFPHVHTEKGLKTAFHDMRHVLAAAGIVVIQILNYSKILKEKKRVVNVTKGGGKIFIRFYDFSDPLIRFNALVMEEHNESFSHNLFSTELFPWSKQAVCGALEEAGFSKSKVYGDYILSVFDEETSDSVVIIAE